MSRTGAKPIDGLSDCFNFRNLIGGIGACLIPRSRGGQDALEVVSVKRKELRWQQSYLGRELGNCLFQDHIKERGGLAFFPSDLLGAVLPEVLEPINPVVDLIRQDKQGLRFDGGYLSDVFWVFIEGQGRHRRLAIEVSANPGGVAVSVNHCVSAGAKFADDVQIIHPQDSTRLCAGLLLHGSDSPGGARYGDNRSNERLVPVEPELETSASNGPFQEQVFRFDGAERIAQSHPEAPRDHEGDGKHADDLSPGGQALEMHASTLPLRRFARKFAGPSLHSFARAA